MTFQFPTAFPTQRFSLALGELWMLLINARVSTLSFRLCMTSNREFHLDSNKNQKTISKIFIAAIDSSLIWIERSVLSACILAGCGPTKFLCVQRNLVSTYRLSVIHTVIFLAFHWAILALHLASLPSPLVLSNINLKRKIIGTRALFVW